MRLIVIPAAILIGMAACTTPPPATPGAPVQTAQIDYAKLKRGVDLLAVTILPIAEQAKANPAFSAQDKVNIDKAITAIKSLQQVNAASSPQDVRGLAISVLAVVAQVVPLLNLDPQATGYVQLGIGLIQAVLVVLPDVQAGK